MNLDEFFEAVERDKDAYLYELKSYALHLLSTSTMKDDDDGIENEIIQTDPTPERWREIFERLKINQLRVIDMANWSQTEFNKCYRKHGISN